MDRRQIEAREVNIRRNANLKRATQPNLNTLPLPPHPRAETLTQPRRQRPRRQLLRLE